MNSIEKRLSTTSKARKRHSNADEVDTTSETSKLSLPGTSKMKEIWSVRNLKELMKPSKEEINFREEKLKESNILQKSSKFFRCTKCLLNFNPIVKNNKKVPVHPNLGVLMCEKCSNYYEDGEFSLDSDGEDKYCRWCGEGGTIFGCAKCICGFCASCIRRHFTADFFKKVKNDDHWLCFFCNPEPLWHLRFICFLAQQTSKGAITSPPKSNKSNNDITRNFEKSPTPESSTSSLNGKRIRYRKRACISSSDESEVGNSTKKSKLGHNSSQCSSKKNEAESFEKIKSTVIAELEKVLKLSEHQLNFGSSWCSKMLKKLKNSECLSTSISLASECKKAKWFLSLLSTYLVQFSNSIDSVEKSLLSKEETKVSSGSPEKNESPYSTILQFLGFISNQVKIFMEKGINLSDILEAKLYDDENIIGLQKKINSPSASCKEKNTKCTESPTNFTPNLSREQESRGSTQEQKGENESKDKSEFSLDIFDDQNSEMNSAEVDLNCSNVTEVDRGFNCSNATVGETNNLKTTDPEEDLQEILAILENA